MKLISNRQLYFCPQCTYVFEIGKLGRCRCGCYVDHVKGKYMAIVYPIWQTFGYLRMLNYGPGGEGHYDDELTVYTETFDHKRTPTTEIFLIDKLLNPRKETKAGIIKPDSFYCFVVELDNGEKLIYDT